MFQRALIILAMAVTAWGAENTPVQPLQSWQGSANDDTKEKEVMKVIVDAGKLKEAWKLCERIDPVPEVDFAKQIVIIQTSRGSRITLGAKLTDTGDLRVMGIETRDFRPGFRYVIAVFPREGVKTVNGAPVPG